MEDQENSFGGTERIKDDFVECEAEYRLLEYLGSGAYGTVCSAQNLSTLEKIAIKKCKNVFKSRTIAKRTLREIRILRHLSHPNIIQLKGLLPTSDPTRNDIFLLFELMDTDLSQIIRSPQDLCVDHVQYFMYQLFSAVAYLHEGNVVHRDIKPKNIMINADCTIKLADFGLARVMTGNPWSKQLAITDYVTTRWYRAPEVLAGWSCYGYSVDIWALGCILVELINRSPIFAGNDSLRQLEKIVAILGKPHQSFINKCLKYSYRRFLQTLPSLPPRAFQEIVPCLNSDAVDLAQRLLVISPNARLSAQQCLKHKFISSYIEVNGLEPLKCKPLRIPADSFQHEVERCEIDVLRKEITFEFEIDKIGHKETFLMLSNVYGELQVERATDTCPDSVYSYAMLPPVSPMRHGNIVNEEENEDSKSQCTEVVSYELKEDGLIQVHRLLSSSTVQEDYITLDQQHSEGKLTPVLEDIGEGSSAGGSAVESGDGEMLVSDLKVATPDVVKEREVIRDTKGENNKSTRQSFDVSQHSSSIVPVAEEEVGRSSRKFSFSSMSGKSFKRRIAQFQQQAANVECEVCAMGISLMTSKSSKQQAKQPIARKIVIPEHCNAVQSTSQESFQLQQHSAVAKKTVNKTGCVIM